ncbi:MAG: Rne/Rng family ribonuclease, partial [Acidobacteriaceae bacterium]|nr:Rne/Rng family ribonuclease [Acidobacteriaceae bacterium]
MPKEIYISSTPHETRLAIVEEDNLSEIYYERENEYTLAGSIYKGRVTRVLPGMQSSFVDVGLERDAFLYITDFMEEAGDSAEFETESVPRTGRKERGGRKERRDSRDSRETATAVTEDGSRDLPSVAEEAPVFEAQETFAESESVQDSDRGSADSEQRAEGGRRWRGRRGRRRGRGGRQTETASGEETSEIQQAPETIEAAAEPAYEEAEAPLYEPDEVIASPAVSEEAPEAEADVFEESAQSVPVTPRQDNERRGGRFDRRRNRGHRVPRTASFDVESAEGSHVSADEDAETERLVLPGESLSKYRAAGESVPAPDAAPAAKPPAVTPTLSAPNYEVPEGWDGGLVLPGENLSRHRRAESQSRPQQFAAEPVEEPCAEPVAAVSEPAVGEPVAPVVVEEVQEAAPAAEPVEYEPAEDASVSYRVEPNPPSEFRQSAPPEAEPEVLETEEPAHEVTTLRASGEMEFAAPVAVDEVRHEAESQAFEPGAGVVVEEVVGEEILDEEEPVGTLHASAFEELDSLDEEEVLGTMIRDISIEEFTRPNHEVEDEEDEFVEEDAVEGSAEADEEAPVETEELDEAEDEEEIEEEDEEDETEDAQSSESRPQERRGRARRVARGGRTDRVDRMRGRRSQGDRRGPRRTMQVTNLPAINELLKPGQEILVQIAKEPIAKKGARITSHIALPGRFLVFMPTVNHVGVSRKIESDGERRRLKEVLLSEKGDASGGFIVRTAAAGATEEELRSDLRFLLNLWSDIKERSETSKAPSLIYHDLNLVERILRDQVGDNFSAIWVDSEENYERILRFLQRFQPSLIRRVKLYSKETPLFEQFGINEEINKALRSKVWLKSGGSIVINQTEALVAIDINTGKYVGKTARLEDTIVKTNLDAIPEIVRQIRLRDLGGIIIIDFIDMDERKNRNR